MEAVEEESALVKFRKLNLAQTMGQDDRALDWWEIVLVLIGFGCGVSCIIGLVLYCSGMWDGPKLPGGEDTDKGKERRLKQHG